MKKKIEEEKEGFYRAIIELEKGERISIIRNGWIYNKPELVFTSSSEGLKLTFTFTKTRSLLNTVIRILDFHVGLIAEGDYYVVEKEED